MKIAISIIQILVSVILIFLISIQSGGGGLGSSFGIGQYHSKKGFEKIVSTTTVVGVVVFLISSLLAVFLV